MSVICGGRNGDRIVIDGSCKLINYLSGTCELTTLIDGSAIPVLKVVDFDYYDGQYEVTPLAKSEVILPTHGLMMARDITVHKVPYYETSNVFNGLTVYIAEDNNG